MTTAEKFFDRHAAGDKEAILEAIDEAVEAYIDGEPLYGEGDDLAEVFENHEQLELVFADLSALELVSLSETEFFIGWSEKRETWALQ